MKALIFTSMFLVCSVAKSSDFDHSHTVWNSLLKTHLDSKNFVDYKALKKKLSTKEKSKLETYLKQLESVSYEAYKSFEKDNKKAFLINAYNAFTVKLILDHYPVDSIKDIGGWFKKPWSMKFFNLLEGKIQSLDPIEHKWLRPKFKDYRIHAAVNCASVSCPVLRNEAYTGKTLDKQLDEQMKVWISDSKRNQVKKESLMLSKIFDWYQSDFKTWGGGVKKVLAKYSKYTLEELKERPIDYKSYDWSLNDSSK